MKARPSGIGSADGRLELVLDETGLRGRGAPTRLESNSNDAWLFADCVLRVCWRGDRARLHREALIGQTLVAEVRYPEVLSHGETEGFPWLLTRRLEGQPLATSWPGMSATDREQAGTQLAEMLRALHTWVPPAETTTALADPAGSAANGLWEITGQAINPLPVDRTLRIAHLLRGRPNVDPGLIETAATLIAGLSDLDPFRAPPFKGIAHCDLHLWNVLWDGHEISALLDLEWARLAPPDLDLDVLVRSVEYSELDGANSPELSLLQRLHLDYPELFAHPDLVRRLWLYALAASIREIAVWPPPGSEPSLERDHPVRQLRRLIAGPHVVEAILDRAARGRS